MHLINDILQGCGLYFIFCLPWLYINFLRHKAKNKKLGNAIKSLDEVK